MEREILETDAATLRQLCGLPATEPLPKKVQDLYWKAKYVCDRVSGYPVRNEFVRICVEAGYGKQNEREANPDVATLWRRKEIKAGQPVLVNWREKKVPGTLYALSAANDATVIIEGQERTVKVDCITLQSAA